MRWGWYEWCPFSAFILFHLFCIFLGCCCCCLVAPQLKFQKKKVPRLDLYREEGWTPARSLNYTFMIVVINISRTLTSVSIFQRSRGPVGLEGKEEEENYKNNTWSFWVSFSFFFVQHISVMSYTQQLFIVISYVSPSLMMPHVVKQKSCCCSSSWRRKWVSFWWQSKLCKIKYSVHLWNRLQEEEEIFFIRNLTRQMSYTIEFPLPPPQKKKIHYTNV